MRKRLLLFLFLFITVVFAEKPPRTICCRIFTKGQLSTKAEFVGGEDAMYRFIYKNLAWRCGEKGYEGKVFVSVVIDRTGKVWNVTIVNPIAPCLDDEIVRAISKMPDWLPATQNGETVCSIDTIPLRIRLGWDEK
jgi:hypothetical protein